MILSDDLCLFSDKHLVVFMHDLILRQCTDLYIFSMYSMEIVPCAGWFLWLFMEKDWHHENRDPGPCIMTEFWSIINLCNAISHEFRLMSVLWLIVKFSLSWGPGIETEEKIKILVRAPFVVLIFLSQILGFLKFGVPVTHVCMLTWQCSIHSYIVALYYIFKLINTAIGGGGGGESIRLETAWCTCSGLALHFVDSDLYFMPH